MESEKAELIKTEGRLVVGGGAGGLWKWVKVVKWYKLPVIRWVSSGGVMYNMGTIVGNAALYTWKLLGERILNVPTTKLKSNNVKDGCVN